MNELRTWLTSCKYPIRVINKGIHDARLQGPGPNPENKKRTLPFVTTHHSNISSNKIVQLSNQLLGNTVDNRLQTAFGNTQIVLALKQPPNLLRQISRAEFTSTKNEEPPPGIITCTRPNCKICSSYLQPCTSFMTSNNVEWFVRRRITCHSKNVIYFLKCLSCDEKVTYSGKTNILRKRTNTHISGCRTGRTTDIFDLHVFECNPQHNEPFFKLYVFVELSDTKFLDSYEKYIHSCNYDTMNR